MMMDMVLHDLQIIIIWRHQMIFIYLHHKLTFILKQEIR
jgi:hypothetical protein